MNEINLESEGLRASVDPLCAELTSLESQGGPSLLWAGNPDTWPGPAPTLFPVIGPLQGGVLRHQGREHPMPAHGFTQHSRFRIVEQAEAGVVLQITDSDETHEHYPFAFSFTVSFSLNGNSLSCVQVVENRSRETLPADLGFHPGPRWPLQADLGKLPDSRPTPVRGNLLELDDSLFSDGPLVSDKLRSRPLTFGASGRLGLKLEFPDSPKLALWMWPGESLLAIEPWHGLPSPDGYTVPFAEKPGVALVPPAASLQHRLTVTTVSMTA